MSKEIVRQKRLNKKTVGSLSWIRESTDLVNAEFHSGAAFRGRAVSLLVASSCGVSRFDF